MRVIKNKKKEDRGRARDPADTPPPRELVFKAHRLLYHSTLGLRAIKRERERPPPRAENCEDRVLDEPVSGHDRGTSLIRNTHPHRITIGP